jgi:hypothetical protein
MSRYGDDYDGEDFPNQLALWQANYERALKGRRGRKALSDLRDALLALPEKKLIEGALCTVNPAKRLQDIPEDSWRYRDLSEALDGKGEGVCAIGALLWHRKVKAGMGAAEAFDSLPTLEDANHGLDDTASQAVSDAGIAYSLAWALACKNDETYGRMTPEERYTAFLAWIDAELGDSAPAAAAS